MSSFEDRTREALNQSADQLDARIRSRLTQARFAAVEEARKQRTPFAWRMWIPIGGAAAAALAVLVWSGGLRQLGPTQSGLSGVAQVQSPFADLDIIAAEENLEMMEEIEFYSWLDTQSAPEVVNSIG